MQKNFFYCTAVNMGVTHCTGRLIGVLNDDAWVNSDWAAHVLDTFRLDPSVGSVASLVLSENRTGWVDSAGDRLSVCGHASNIGWGLPRSEVPSSITEVFSAAGSCAVYRRDAFMLAGGFDGQFIAYLDDIDLGFRLQLLGFRCVFNPSCVAFHEGGATYKPRLKALYLTERNMCWNIAKNMPRGLLMQYGQLIARAHAQPAPIAGGASVAGWAIGKAHAHLQLGSVLKKRRQIQQRRCVSDDYIRGILSSPTSIGICHL